MVDTLPRASISERGIKDWLASALRMLRLAKDAIQDDLDDPTKWPADFVKEFGVSTVPDLSAWLASKLIMRLIEDAARPRARGSIAGATPLPISRSTVEKPAPASFDGVDPDQAGARSSSTVSPRAPLAASRRSHRRGAAGLADAARLLREHIYAFEHRTMSESPIENAIQLVTALPRNANVYLVSHSRGGLVGDLLSLQSIGATHLGRFNRRDPDLEDADQYDRKKLGELAEIVTAKKLRVQRFLRCAAPSRGTLLAGENIDIRPRRRKA